MLKRGAFKQFASLDARLSGEAPALRKQGESLPAIIVPAARPRGKSSSADSFAYSKV
jgi:hypothetical protein